MSRVDNVIRYIEVYFTFIFSDYVRYIEFLFHISYCNFGRDVEFRSLNRGSTVVAFLFVFHNGKHRYFSVILHFI